MASERTYRAAIVSERAQENRAYVRTRLKEKQPEFATILEFIVRELAEEFTTAGRGTRGLGRALSAALTEVVGPVLYLLSSVAGYMTGRALRLDSGAGLGPAGALALRWLKSLKE